MRDARAASDAKPADDADGQAWCVGTGNPLTPVVTSVALQPRQPLLVEAPLPAAHLPELRFDAESNRLSSAFDAATLPPTLARARIHPDSLQPSTVLGSGAFGLVFDGSWRRHPSTEASSTFDGSMEGHPNPADDDASSSPTPLRVAIKQIHRHRLEADQLNDMKRAAIIELELTPHPNILRLYGWSVDPRSATLRLAMELCDGGSLASLLEAPPSHTWSVHQMLQASLQIGQGMAFLHAQAPPIVHRDLKPANILFAGGVAKLADFGASRVADATWMSAMAGTPLFAAPELLTFQCYTALVDVWSYGCVLACIALHQITPYGTRAQLTDALLAQVASGSLHPTVAADHPLHALVRDCCSSPQERLDAQGALTRLMTVIQLCDVPS